MRGIIEEYGMFIAVAAIGIVMFLVMFGYTIDNDDYDNTIDDNLFSISAGDNKELASRPKPSINVTNAAIKLGATDFEPMKYVKSAVDADGTNLKSKVTYSGTVDTKRIGRYPIEYSVTDSYGLKTTETVYFMVSPYGTKAYNIMLSEYLTADQEMAIEGAVVKITFTTIPGYRCKSFSLKKENGTNISYIGTMVGQESATITFTMPNSNVIASAEAEAIPE